MQVLVSLFSSRQINVLYIAELNNSVYASTPDFTYHSSDVYFESYYASISIITYCSSDIYFESYHASIAFPILSLESINVLHIAELNDSVYTSTPVILCSEQLSDFTYQITSFINVLDFEKDDVVLVFRPK